MKQEEAIKGLKAMAKDFNGYKPNEEMFEMAISALEKQTPKMVGYIGDGYSDGNMVYDQAECPNCGCVFEDPESAWEKPFCPHCGQALLWDDKK